ncbi:MAG: prephenate dehydratase [Alicyclobacillus sp.]|nr:prephenate dehydratase [Alicyclobacillus sp.]
MRIAYLGPSGTFTETAAKAYLQAVNVGAPVPTDPQLIPLQSIPAALEAVATGGADAAVVPMENAIQGTVHATIDALLQAPSLAIVMEVLLPIQQDLLMRPGGRVEDVREVWSHPQALAQCSRFIRRVRAQEVAYPSTAAAARAVAESGRTDVAAIASGRSAVQWGLTVTARGIADQAANFTRFAAVVPSGPATLPAAGDPVKTMLVVTPGSDAVGVLASILSVLATLGHNLCWIESRPTRVQLGTYQFFLEIQSHIAAEETKRALAVLAAYGHEVRCLGCYRAYRLPPD